MLERIADPVGFERSGALFLPVRKMPIPPPSRRLGILRSRDAGIVAPPAPPLFVAVGTTPTSNDGAVATSNDGVTWVAGSIPSGVYNGVVWADALKLFVAVGKNVAGTSGVVATSPDGVIWTAQTAPAISMNAVAWNGTTLAAVGQSISSGPTSASSTDGLAWFTRNLSNAVAWNAACWSGTKFVVTCGTNFASAQSADGITWASIVSMGGGSPFAVVWSPTFGDFISVGKNAAVQYSPTANNATWSRYQMGGVAGNFYYTICLNGVVCLALGGDTTVGANTASAIFTSATAFTQYSAPNVMARGVVWDGTKYVTVGFLHPSGFTGAAATSSDGQSWTSRTIPNAIYNALALRPGG